MRKINVALGDRSYDIRVGHGLLAKLGVFCTQAGLQGRCVVITDETVGAIYARPVEKALKDSGLETATISLPAGESAKRLRQVEGCYRRMADLRLERRSFVVALGGGVVGDIAGFVAATYLRGIPFVQAPTTLLAQVDSSVGGKVGVNLPHGKNLVGAFYQPRLVVCDLDTLASLPQREFRSGMAEVIKYGIIFDGRFFRVIERGLTRLLGQDKKTLGRVVARSCEIKADVVRQDEKELGLRAILNFGHTIGHAIEAITGYRQFLHGEAISIGQVAATALSRQLAGMGESEAQRIRDVFQAAGLPVSMRLNAGRRSRLVDAMALDKKVQGGRIRFILARQIGEATPGQMVDRATLERFLKDWFSQQP